MLVCVVQVVDIPELEEEGKEDITRMVRRQTWHSSSAVQQYGCTATGTAAQQQMQQPLLVAWHWQLYLSTPTNVGHAAALQLGCSCTASMNQHAFVSGPSDIPLVLLPHYHDHHVAIKP
jgi:hypothetical protein